MKTLLRTVFCLLQFLALLTCTHGRYRQHKERFYDLEENNEANFAEEEDYIDKQQSRDDDLLKEILRNYQDISDAEQIPFPEEFDEDDGDGVLISPLPKDQHHASNKKWCKRKPEYKYTSLDCKLTVQTLKAMLNFFLSNTDKIIADGLYGMRLAQGAILHIAKHLERTHLMYPTIAGLAKLLTDASKFVYDKVKAKGSKYDTQFLTVLDRPTDFYRTWRNTNHSLVWDVRVPYDKGFSEGQSDHCIGEVLGTNPDSKRKCVFSKKCMEMERKPRTGTYYLTHQTLYFITAQTHGCQEGLQKEFGSEKNLNHFYDIIGANINAEMRSTSLKTIRPLDLFAEQGAICSMLGIVECLQRHHLHDVMKFVNSRGCIPQEEEKRKRRKRRLDVSMDGCSQHQGAVVMGYLANQLRFMLLPPACHLLD